MKNKIGWIIVIVIVGIILLRLESCVSNMEREAEALPAMPTAEEMAQRERDAAEAAEKDAKNLHTGLVTESLSTAARASRGRMLLEKYPDSEYAADAERLLPELEAAEQAAKDRIASRGAWRYSEEVDPMTKKASRRGHVISENTLSFDFPYSGAQHARLIVRNHPQHGKQVIVTIERGQILCSSYECPVRIAFDDGAPITVSGNPAADHSSDVVFLPGYSNLTRKMANATEMRVQFNVFQEGAPTVTFPVKGFNRELQDP